MTILQRISVIEKARGLFVKKTKRMAFWEHSLIIILGGMISFLLYLIFIRSLSLSFKNPPTTTISWFTVNNYPREQDYFYFFTSFIFVTVITCLTWVLFIWLRKSK